MHSVFDTSLLGSSNHQKQSYWRDAVSAVFYQLGCEIRDPEFYGKIVFREFGNVRIIRLRSAEARYVRRQQDCDGTETCVLVCIPLVETVELEQLGRRPRCLPGHFLLEYSDAPYRFEYGTGADMIALRIPESVLRSRIRSPSRFCALEFDARSGIAKLFIDYLNLISASPHLHPGDVQSLVSAQLVDLLVAVLEQDHRVLQSASSSIRNAHLVRIEQYIIKNLYDPDLSAERIAAACNISVRYLHLLFADTGETLARWIRDRRLQLAYEKIVSTKSRASICQIAYAHGFNDHAQFSSAFRKKYGCSPKSVLGSARASEDT